MTISRTAITAVLAATAVLAGVQPATAQAAPRHCPAAALKVSARDGGAGLSHQGTLLVFTNISASTCTLTGYPHVFVVDARGRTVTGATRTLSGYLGGVRGHIATVTLASRASGSALLEGLAIRRNGDGCPAEPELRLTSPQTFTPVLLRAGTDICTDVEVHPVVAGVLMP